MSEKTTKTPATEGEKAPETGKKTGTKKAETKEKKDNFVKRGYRKTKKAMSEHPFWTAFGGGIIGSGVTIGVGYGAKKIQENRQAKKNAYIPQGQEDNFDPNV